MDPAPPLPHGAPPPLPHRPPPPPPSSYIMGMSTSSSYMSGEGYQSLQSMMKTEGPSYAPMPPSYGLPYHPHVYPHQNPPPPGPPPPTTYPPPNLPPPTPSYPPPGYNPSYPPPRMPPGHTVPPPVMGLPPTGYPPPPGQPQVPLPPHGMPPVAGMNRGNWMRWDLMQSQSSACLNTLWGLRLIIYVPDKPFERLAVCIECRYHRKVQTLQLPRCTVLELEHQVVHRFLLWFRVSPFCRWSLEFKE